MEVGGQAQELQHVISTRLSPTPTPVLELQAIITIPSLF